MVSEPEEKAYVVEYDDVLILVVVEDGLGEAKKQAAKQAQGKS